MESTNDEESSDLISCDELDNSQLDRLSVQVSSLEKLVDYCAEEFSKLVFMLVVSKPSRFFWKLYVCCHSRAYGKSDIHAAFHKAL